MSEPAFPDALPLQYRLHWYVVERVLGQGGFGITYLARDSNLDQSVAIKEYLPGDIATRRPDATIRSRTDDHRERYRWGLDRFIKEARTLARFDHPNIVRVHSVFEANNTAYMVMRFEAGETLSAVLDSRGMLSEQELFRIMLPVLDGLSLVHEAGFIHRDIKPDNIHIRTDGSPVLLDFGSARSAGGKPHTLTILVAPGYAPFEQYYGNSESQGPWTDIYGLGATCYRAIAGRAPLDAISRSKGILGNTRDVMVPATVVGAGRYSGRLLAAIDHALAFGERERPQTIAEWREELIGSREVPSTVPLTTETAPTQRLERPPASTPSPQPVSREPGPPSTSRLSRPGPMVWAIGAVAIIAIAIGIVVGRLWPTPPVTDSDLQQRIASLEAQLKEQQRLAQEQRREAERAAEAARKQQDAVETERKANEAAEVERRRKDAVEAERKLKEAAETERKLKEDLRVASERLRATEAALQREAAERARLQSKLEAIESKPGPSAGPPPKPPPVVEPATPTQRAERAISGGDYAGALALLRPLAEAGNARAQFLLGKLYADGRGIRQNDATAASWYHRAAARGEPNAQVAYADALAEERGVPQDYLQAYIWYSLAARQGNAQGRAGRDRVVKRLQPAEIKQGDAQVEGWTPVSSAKN